MIELKPYSPIVFLGHNFLNLNYRGYGRFNFANHFLLLRKPRGLLRTLNQSPLSAIEHSFHYTITSSTTKFSCKLIHLEQLSVQWNNSCPKFSEVSTHYSSSCCLQMTSEGCRAIKILANLIESCNRSVPHIEVISTTLEIFMNLAECGVSFRKRFFDHSTEVAFALLIQLSQV